MRLRRTPTAVIAGLLALAGLVGIAVTPAAAVVGGIAAEAPYAGIGSLQVEANGISDWGFCSAHLLGSGHDGKTDLALTSAHCVDAPGAAAQVEVQGPALQVTTQAGVAPRRLLTTSATRSWRTPWPAECASRSDRMGVAVSAAGATTPLSLHCGP